MLCTFKHGGHLVGLGIENDEDPNIEHNDNDKAENEDINNTNKDTVENNAPEVTTVDENEED